MGKLIIFIIGIFLISSISATTILTPTPTSIDKDSTTLSVHYEITTTGFAGQKGIQVTGLPSFISYSGGSISYNANTTTSGDIVLLVNIPDVVDGDYENYITIDGTVLTIPIKIETEDPTNCNLNPSLVSYTQTIQQGTEVELPKIIFNPTNCQGDLSITSAYISGGITTSEGQKPVYIKTASSTDVLLGVNTNGLGSLTYPTRLTIVAFGKTFSDISTITIIVTGGTTPQGNFSVNNLPTCSLTNTDLNVNSTYSLVCTNLQPDISIFPIIDNDYIQGTGEDTTSNQYIWYFKAKKMGNTKIKANFYYRGNSPVGDSFSQEVRIISSGSVMPGTSLKILFSPSLDKLSDGQETIIQLADNKTGSLVDSPEIYVNAIALTPLNNSTKSFPFIMEVNKDYEIRGKAVGYEDIIQIVNISTKPITITINPSKTDYYIGDIINITTSVNASILVDGNLISGNSYEFNNMGNITIKVVKEGYDTTEKILNVILTSIFQSSSCTIDPEKWKKGEEIVCGLSKEADWKVYLNDTLISEGTGTEINFEITEEGLLEVKVGSVGLFSKVIEKKGIWIWMKENWLWEIIVLIGVGIVGYIIFLKDDEEDVQLGGE